jgi:hydrogenase expression/formation protein HypC
MCLAVPAKIINLEEYTAVVDIMGVEGEINIQLIENPKQGDYVLVHAGCAIQVIDTEYYKFLRETFEEMMKVEHDD